MASSSVMVGSERMRPVGLDARRDGLAVGGVTMLSGDVVAVQEGDERGSVNYGEVDRE